MPEHIVELNENNAVVFPEDLITKMELTPGDNLLLRMNDGVLEVKKLNMSASENGEKIDHMIGQKVKINRH